MSRPVGARYAAPVPHGRTARRLTWEFLPPALRRQVEQQLGATVVRHESQQSGFTPGFASVLTGDDGSRVFVKAASRVAQAPFAAAYAEEARKLRLLGDRIPAPRLLWTIDDDWVVLGIEAVSARHPTRPWEASDLQRALDVAETVAATTAEVPAGLSLAPVHADQPGLLSGWKTVRVLDPGWPHLAEAAELAAALPGLPHSDRLVHTDLRDDNILLCDDGRDLACDWNWPALGPAWLDLVTLLATAHGDGLAVDEHLAERALTREVEADHVDVWLAALCGFMLEARERPSPSSSPYLQTHTFWMAEATWGWLAERRGWA